MLENLQIGKLPGIIAKFCGFRKYFVQILDQFFASSSTAILIIFTVNNSFTYTRQ